MTETWFDQLHMPADGDVADVWAAMREHDLRQRRYRLAKLGVIGIVMEVREAVEKLSESFRGSMDGVGDRIGNVLYGDADLR